MDNYSQRPWRLLTIAALDWRNGHEYALQAARLLKRRGVDFVYRIVGNGPFLEAVAFARHELGLEERVELVLNDSKLRYARHLAWADCFVLAAVSESAYHATVQAVDAGLPVICTNVPGLIARFKPTAHVCFVSKRDPQALLNGLLQEGWCA